MQPLHHASTQHQHDYKKSHVTLRPVGGSIKPVNPKHVPVFAVVGTVCITYYLFLLQ